MSKVQYEPTDQFLYPQAERNAYVLKRVDQKIVHFHILSPITGARVNSSLVFENALTSGYG